MLDRDLAELYGVETRVLNQAVRRNSDRFPDDFAFELTRQEIIGISQIVTSSRLKFSKRVTVFTSGLSLPFGIAFSPPGPKPTHLYIGNTNSVVRFAYQDGDTQARRDNNEELKKIIERWLGRFPSREAAIEMLEQNRIPCAPVLSLHEAMAHPHLRERGTVRRASMASFPADLSTFGPGIQKLAAEGRGLTAMDYFHAFEKATDAANRSVAVPLQTRYDFLLTPTLGLPPMKIEDVPSFLGDAWARYVRFVLPVSFARTPAISIPAGLHDGLPVGVQLVGRFTEEYELLDFAEELEQMPGFGFQRPPEVDG